MLFVAIDYTMITTGLLSVPFVLIYFGNSKHWYVSIVVIGLLVAFFGLYLFFKGLQLFYLI